MGILQYTATPHAIGGICAHVCVCVCVCVCVESYSSVLVPSAVEALGLSTTNSVF